MRKNNSNLRGFETTAVGALAHRMTAAGATIEEIGKVTDYFLAAVEFDCAKIQLEDIARRTDIKAIAEKYDPLNGVLDIISAMEILKDITKSKPEEKSSEIKVGDQITVNLKGFGEFTATAHKVTDKDILYIFDDYVTERPMNENNTNDGGFEKSDLKKWMDSELLTAFPDEIRNKITKLSIPSVGELFGWNDEWDKEHFESDEDEQLPLMKQRRNRVAYLNNECSWGWLRNVMKKKHSAAHFAYVDYYGNTYYSSASHSYGVRPEFLLVR